MKPKTNPLLDAPLDNIVVDHKAIQAPTTVAIPRSQKTKRELLKLFRQESATVAVERFTQDVDVFGVTKGQFSLIDLIQAVVAKTGPADLVVSTWTAATADVKSCLEFMQAGQLTGARFLIDFSFQRRQPAVAQAIRDTFGHNSLRVTQNHAKFFMLNAPGWTVTCKTSMNLNQNPRLEDFDLSNDPALNAFLLELVGDLFKRMKAPPAGELRPGWAAGGEFERATA